MTAPIVTIDGPAGAGKSAVAKITAERLGFNYLDTGATYRAVALYVIRTHTDIATADIPARMADIDVKFDKEGRVILNGENVTEQIRSREVNALVSLVAANPDVRKAMVALQRSIAREGAYVLDGRDIGAVVFPDSNYKFYLDAEPEERARRRFKEEQAKGMRPVFEEILANVAERDRMDATREISPLIRPDDAYYIDSTNMTIEAVVETILTICKQKNLTPLPVTETDMTEEPLNAQADEETARAEAEFKRALEAEGDAKAVVRGAVLKGRVLNVDDSYVYVDLGYKSEGKIKRDEFNVPPNEGDEIEVEVISAENREGDVIVSKTALEKKRAKALFDDAFERKTNLNGYVKSAVKGGYTVVISGMQVFCPGSQLDTRRGANDNDYLGKEFEFRVIKKQGNDIVVSRRAILEEQQKYTIAKFMESLTEGETIRGKVKNIETFGVFVEIVPGLDGFLALSNLSWDKGAKAKETLKKGDEREFKVLSVDKAKHRVELGLKQLEEDPWDEFAKTHRVNDVIKGEVMSLKDYGAFIKVTSGVEGLAHISDLSWARRIHHPKEALKKGDYVECMILEIDNEKRRLGLGVKQVTENPWEGIDALIPVGKSVSGEVKEIHKNFAVIRLPEGLEGTIDVSEFDWKNNVVNINNFLKEGETREFMILSADPKTRKIRLGFKQLTENPWLNFKRAHPKGSVVEGNVVKIQDGVGAIVAITDGIDGFVHISQVAQGKVENIEDALTVGETYPFVIVEVNPDRRRVALSRKEYFNAEEKKELQEYMTKDTGASMTYSIFADKLKDLEEKNKRHNAPNETI